MSRRILIHRLFLVLVLATLPVTATIAQDPGSDPAAKNVILMIADGAGFNAFLASAYYQYGDVEGTPYADFPVHCGMSTFAPKTPEAADLLNAGEGDAMSGTYEPAYIWHVFNNCRQPLAPIVVTDSAAAGTVLNTGQKTTNGRIAVSADGETELTTFAQLADELGKATGAVTSVEISHATPACVAAHNPSRNNYAAIAEEMFTDSPLDVVMGAGHPDAAASSGTVAARHQYIGGTDIWADLTDEDGVNGFTFFTERSDFTRLAEGVPPSCSDVFPTKVAGIASAFKTLNESSTTIEPTSSVPTLELMSRGALNVLAQDPDGFYLMIEGGAIDWANHANDFPAMIREMVEFNNAVEAVVAWVETNSSWDETLLIVTADHETGQLWGAGAYDDANGNQRFDAATETFNGFIPPSNAGRGELPDHLYGHGSHTNHLVPVWAIGAGSSALLDLADETDDRAADVWNFSGRYIDNTEIFPVMRDAIDAE